MKKLVFLLIILGFILMSCLAVNHPPTQPANPKPSNGETGVLLTPNLS